MRPLVMGLIAATLAAALAGYGFGRHGAPSDSAVEMKSLRQRLDALEKQRTGNVLAAPSGSRDSGEPLSSHALSSSPRTRNDGRMRSGSIGATLPPPEEIARQQAMRRSQLDAAFRAEPIEATWSQRAESELAERVAANTSLPTTATPDTLTTECRGRSCRIAGRFRPGSDVDGWTTAYVLGASGTLAQAEVVQVRQADGAVELAIYGQRP